MAITPTAAAAVRPSETAVVDSLEKQIDAYLGTYHGRAVCSDIMYKLPDKVQVPESNGAGARVMVDRSVQVDNVLLADITGRYQAAGWTVRYEQIKEGHYLAFKPAPARPPVPPIGGGAGPV